MLDLHAATSQQVSLILSVKIYSLIPTNVQVEGLQVLLVIYL